MASEIRVDKINSLSGVGTVTLSPTGVDIAGITTAATLRATTGIVTSLTAGSLTSLGAVSGTTGTFSGAVSGTTGTFSGAVSGTTGTFTGDLTIPDKIVHTGDTNTALRFPAADTITAETGGSEKLRIDSSGRLLLGSTSSTATGVGNSKLQISGTGADTAGAALIRTTNDAGGAYLQFVKNRGAATQNNDNCGALAWLGHDGTDTNNYFAQIVVSADATSTNNSMNGRMEFHTTSNSTVPTERLRIASDGRITQITGDLVIDQSNNGYGGLRILDSTAGEYSINYIAGRNSGATAHVFSIGGRTQNSSPWANASQNECARISQRGISFNGDDAQANALDDYEEGTFTPAMNQGINVSSYTNQDGHYIKVGNLVQVSFRIKLSGSGSGNHVRFQGLPINSANLTNYTSGGIVTYTNIDGLNGGGTMSVWMGSNSSLCELYKDGNSSAATGSGGFTNKDIYVVLTYRSA